MLRGLVCAFAVLLTLSVCLAQPLSLENETLLQRRITVWLKMEPMRDALRQISRQTGISLRCIDAIAEEKVAIFVEDRPAHEILTQLAKLFRYEWRKHEGGGYILYVPDETRLQEEKIANAIREARRQALRDLVQAAREIRKLSFEQRAEERRKLYESRSELSTPQHEARRTALIGMTPYKPYQRSPEGEWVEMEEYGFSPEYAVYQCLVALPDRAVEALLDGQTIGFSTKPGAGILALSDDALLPNWMRYRRWTRTVASDGQEFFQERTAPNNPEFAGVWLRMSSRVSAIEYQLVSVARSDTEGVSELETASPRLPYLHRYESGIPLSVAPYLKNSALWQFWEAWATPEKPLREAFPERFTPRTDRPKPELPRYHTEDIFSNRSITAADALEQVAWATRRPVISDAFRGVSVFLWSARLDSPQSVVLALREYCWLRADESGYLLARHKHYWFYRRYELPEAWLRPLEQKYEQQGWLTLEDYIALAGKLTDAQVEYLTQTRHYSYQTFPLTRFEFDMLVACLPALRFLASLNAAQRQQLTAGQWLPVGRLNSTQQRRFLQAVGDRYPPAQHLFREPLPEHQLPDSEKSQNLLTTRWMGWLDGLDNDKSIISPDETPQAPAVRLRPEPEQLYPFILHSQEYIGAIISGEAASRYIQDYLKQELEKDPGSRLMAARVRRVHIEFIDAQGERRKYEFVLTRYEPYTLPPPKETNSDE